MDPAHLSPPSRLPLLSEEYRRLNAELHERVPSYGTTGRQYVGLIRRLARERGARHILDYGCGKRDLAAALGREFEVREFDPALPGLDALPAPADLVACIDVLEHVEPDYLDNVLTDLARVTLQAALLTIATRPSGKLLADGTNPHRIVERPAWWLAQLENYFQLAKVELPPSENGLVVVAEPRCASAAQIP